MRQAIFCTACMMFLAATFCWASSTSELAGTWQATVDNAQGHWQMTWVIAPDGAYRLYTKGPRAAEDSGKFSGENGKWSLESASGRDDGGTYSFAGGDEVIITGKLGPGTWKRVTGTAAQQAYQMAPSFNSAPSSLDSGSASRGFSPSATAQETPSTTSLAPGVKPALGSSLSAIARNIVQMPGIPLARHPNGYDPFRRSRLSQTFADRKAANDAHDAQLESAASARIAASKQAGFQNSSNRALQALDLVDQAFAAGNTSAASAILDREMNTFDQLHRQEPGNPMWAVGMGEYYGSLSYPRPDSVSHYLEQATQSCGGEAAAQARLGARYARLQAMVKYGRNWHAHARHMEVEFSFPSTPYKPSETAGDPRAERAERAGDSDAAARFRSDSSTSSDKAKYGSR